MSESRASMLLAVVGVLVVAAAAQAQQPRQADQACRDGAMPGNVDPGVFAAEMRTLVRRSDTFRRQCARIAADRRVRVRVSIVNSVDGGARAQTTIRRGPRGTLDADIDVRFGGNYRELLAHEFEHVIEQIDGVNLSYEAAAGRAWQVAAGTFETRRAFAAGRRAAREAETRRGPRARTAVAVSTRW
jgi:hypothetical protein